MLVFFLKDFAPGGMRWNKSESFHLKDLSFYPLYLQGKPPKSSDDLLSEDHPRKKL